MYDDPDDRIAEALARPFEEREKLDLRRPTPVDQLERTRLKPLPTRGRKGVVPK